MSKSDTSEFDYFVRSFDNYAKDIPELNLTFVNNFIDVALQNTRVRTPVDTGELKRRWETTLARQEGATFYAELNNPQEYASYVEEWEHIPGLSIKGGVGHHMSKRGIEVTIQQQQAIYDKTHELYARKKGIL